MTGETWIIQCVSMPTLMLIIRLQYLHVPQSLTYMWKQVLTYYCMLYLGSLDHLLISFHSSHFPAWIKINSRTSSQSKCMGDHRGHGREGAAGQIMKIDIDKLYPGAFVIPHVVHDGDPIDSMFNVL